MTSNLSAIGGGTNLSRVVARQRATICRSNRAGLDFRVSCRALSRDNARYVSASYEINGFDSSDNARCRALSRVVARQRAQSECTFSHLNHKLSLAAASFYIGTSGANGC